MMEQDFKDDPQARDGLMAMLRDDSASEAVGSDDESQRSSDLDQDRPSEHHTDNALLPDDFVSKSDSDSLLDVPLPPPRLPPVSRPPAGSPSLPPVLLICPVNQRSHDGLYSFGLPRCPLCGQFLRQANLRPAGKIHPGARYPFRAPFTAGLQTVSGPRGRSTSSSSTTTKSKKSNSSPSPPPPTVSHKAAFLDSANGLIESVPWKGPFDLKAARKGLALENNVFSVETLVSTSVEYNGHTSNKPGFHESGLKNPDIFMEVKMVVLTIHSHAVIRILQDVVSYNPQTSLRSYKVEFVEPYTLLAHHLDELETYR